MLPIIPTLGAWYHTLFLVLFVVVCLFMMLVILIQKPRGGGLSGAFGGAGGSSSSVFGSKTGDVLTWFTVICFCLFIGLAMLLTWTIKPEDAGTGAPSDIELPTGKDAGLGDLGQPIGGTPAPSPGTPGPGKSGTPTKDAAPKKE